MALALHGYIIYASLTHLWKIRWNVCSVVSTQLGFFPQHSGKGPIKDWHDPQYPQGSHKNQGNPMNKDQAKDCTSARHLGLKNLNNQN